MNNNLTCLSVVENNLGAEGAVKHRVSLADVVCDGLIAAGADLVKVFSKHPSLVDVAFEGWMSVKSESEREELAKNYKRARLADSCCLNSDFSLSGRLQQLAMLITGSSPLPRDLSRIVAQYMIV